MISNYRNFMECFTDMNNLYATKKAKIRENLPGWNINSLLKIEPIYLALQEDKMKIERNETTVEKWFDKYVELFSEEFDRFLGWVEPRNEIELLNHFERFMYKEAVLQNHMYYFVRIGEEIVGVLYFYDYKEKYKRANLTIGLSCKYRGRNFCSILMDTLFNEFMKPENPKLIRIGCEIETTNITSIRVMSKKKEEWGFEEEGLLRNNYGSGIDCVLFSKIVR